MKILGIETSAQTASVALASDGEVIAERAFEARMTLNRRLALEIAEVAGCPARDAGLEGIATGIGPGSFTGVRMGVAVAKALAHALELPLAGVSAPEAIATGLEAEAGTAVCVLQRARADEVYATALVVAADGIAEEVEPTRVLRLPEAFETAEELLGRAPEIIAGDCVDSHAGPIRAAFAGAKLAGDEHAQPAAGWVVQIAQLRPERLAPEAAFGLTPRYARASQAERQFGVDLGMRG